MTKNKECLAATVLFLVMAFTFPMTYAQTSHMVPDQETHQRIKTGELTPLLIMLAIVGLPVSGFLYWRWTRK